MIATNSRSISSIPFRYYVISFLFPLGLILVLRSIPQIDLELKSPLAHFYIVIAISFTGVILAGLANTLSRVSGRAQVLLTSLGLLSIAGLLLIHGLSTAGALLPAPTPGSGWSAKLSLVVGALFFVLSGIRWPASIDTLLIKRYRTIISAVSIVYAFFFLVVFAFPSQLAVLDQAGPIALTITLIAALSLYGLAIILYVIRLRVDHQRLDGVILAGLLILTTAVISQTSTVWYLSWWTYHFLIGIAILVITLGLNNEYRRLQSASLLRNYFVFGLTVIALLALVASEIFFRINRDNLTHERERSAIQLASHLTLQLQTDLPEATTLDGLSSIGSNEMLTHVLEHNLEGLDIVRLKLYDRLGKIVFSTANTATGEAQATAALLSALAGTPQSNLKEGVEPEVSGEPKLSGEILETYAPLRDSNTQVIGAVEIYQNASDLAVLAIQQRGQFLITVSILMTLLFGGFAFFVRRADQLVAARAAELNDIRASLQQSERTRQDMTNVVISNVRRPMATLTRSIDQIQRGTSLSPEQGELIGRAHNNAREVNNTVYNLLNISQIENGELHLQLSTFPINDLLQATVQEITESARDAAVTVRTEVRPGLPYVWADRELIGRVINNLLSNAIKHTRRGERVLLNADVEPDGNIVVRVQDQGDGISAEDQAHIFDKFARIGSETAGEGTGLGLAFCKMTIEQHQGRLWVESTVGHGSTFAFTLPTLTTAAAI